MATVVTSASSAGATVMRHSGVWLCLAIGLSACGRQPVPAAPTSAPGPDLAGMWSDPPRTALDAFCFFACTDLGLRRLAELLDDPANDARPYAELSADASQHQIDDYIRPGLTEAALAAPPLDPLQDPGYLNCEPWGFARQTFAPHQLEIKQYADHVELHYGEWDAHRIVRLGERTAPQDRTHVPLGYSVGHYEGDTLVVETTMITANLGPMRILEDGRHSDELTAIERYRRPAPERLELTATLTDPVTFREPLVLKKVWKLAPDQEIAPYDSCEPAAAKPPEGKTQ
jgi:hypothetical protein